MVGMTLAAKDAPEDFEVCLSELVIVSRVEDSRHTPVQQGFNHLVLQQAYLQTESGGRHIVLLRTDPLVACPHEWDPSLDPNNDVSVLVHIVADKHK